MSKTGGQAFPFETALEPGATWLDVCAWHAMQGILSATPDQFLYNDRQVAWGAKRCYEIAKAMLAEKQRIENET